MNWSELRAWIKELGTPIAAACFLGWLLVRHDEQARIDRAAYVESVRVCCLGKQVAK